VNYLTKPLRKEQNSLLADRRILYSEPPILIIMSDTLSLSIDRLPLAVYYEIAAHLRQLSNIQVEILPQTDPTFDYLQSQVGGLSIDCSKLSVIDRARANEIIDYYHQRYGATEYHSQK
jgi:hypothetical protein